MPQDFDPVSAIRLQQRAFCVIISLVNQPFPHLFPTSAAPYFELRCPIRVQIEVQGPSGCALTFKGGGRPFGCLAAPVNIHSRCSCCNLLCVISLCSLCFIKINDKSHRLCTRVAQFSLLRDWKRRALQLPSAGRQRTSRACRL